MIFLNFFLIKSEFKINFSTVIVLLLAWTSSRVENYIHHVVSGKHRSAGEQRHDPSERLQPPMDTPEIKNIVT